MMKEKHDLILLLSGGLDSALLLEMCLSMNKEPYCLLIDYGQKHLAELVSAQQLCLNKGVNWQRVEVDGLVVHSKLTDGIVTYPGVSEWYVPARNLIFIGIAASFAESMNVPLIWYGANYEDRDHLFPDCYQEWVYEMNKLLAINGSMKIQLEAPLLGMDKPTIKALANRFGISNEELFSGYGQ
jgi:7-cyano-7-deazaguanine synthase